MESTFDATEKELDFILGRDFVEELLDLNAPIDDDDRGRRYDLAPAPLPDPGTAGGMWAGPCSRVLGGLAVAGGMPPVAALPVRPPRPAMPPVVHPAPLSGLGGRQRRADAAARPVAGFSPRPTAAAARAARLAARRAARARGQVVRLVGGGDIQEIRRRAVSDAERGAAVSLGDIAGHMYPQAWVASAFESPVTVTTAAPGQTPGGPMTPATGRPRIHVVPMRPAIAGTAARAPPFAGAPLIAPRPVCPALPNIRGAEPFAAPRPAAATAVAATVAVAATAAPPAGRVHLKQLPVGKDPASRRLRRLLRNRQSAQASRDRRRRALADQRRLKAAKEEEIKKIEQRLVQETQHEKLLEEAISFAREYLGPAKCKWIAATVHRGIAALTK